MIKRISSSNLGKGFHTVINSNIDQTVDFVMDILERLKVVLENTELKEGDYSLVPEELFLIVPALLNKVDKGNASANEMMAAAVIGDISSFFVMDPTDALDVDEDSVTTATVNHQDYHKQRKQEIESLVNRVYELVPSLEDPLALVETFGFSYFARQAIRSSVSESPDVATSKTMIGRWLFKNLDRISLDRLQEAVKKLERKPISPTISLLTRYRQQPELRHAWCDMLLAVLSSPRVNLSRTVVRNLNMAGLSEILDLWQEAQQKRKTVVNGDVQQEICEALKSLSSTEPYKLTIEGHNLHDLHHVVAIESATYGYNGLTNIMRSSVDCTDLLRKKFLKNGTLYLKDVNLDEELQLSTYIDSMRMWVGRTQNVLTITYYKRVEEEQSFPLKVQSILDHLKEHGFIRQLHADDGHYTWYKLPEWMQVEIIEYSSPENMVEQIVIADSPLDKVISFHEIAPLKVVDGFHVLTVSTFKIFSNAVLAIARRCPHSRFLQLSNQNEIQMKLLIPRKTTRDDVFNDEVTTIMSRLSALSGCTVMFDYIMPVDGTSNKPGKHVSMCVEVPFLIQAINNCDAIGVDVQQLYDWYA